MTRKTLLTLSLALVLVAGGLVVASNMGFKFVPNYNQAGVDFWVSIPYNNNYTNAQSICLDITSLVNVARFNTSAGLREDWLCPLGTNFTVTSGEGFFFRVGAPDTPVIVGSHDPSLSIPVGGFSLTGTDYILSIPYHTTAATANDICAEVPSAVNVARFNTASSLREDWLCPLGTNFTVNIGEALAVRVGATSSGFVPTHY